MATKADRMRAWDWLESEFSSFPMARVESLAAAFEAARTEGFGVRNPAAIPKAVMMARAARHKLEAAHHGNLAEIEAGEMADDLAEALGKLDAEPEP